MGFCGSDGGSYEQNNNSNNHHVYFFHYFITFHPRLSVLRLIHEVRYQILFGRGL